MLRLDRRHGALTDDSGRLFDPLARAWAPSEPRDAGEPADLRDAVRWLQRDSNHPVRAPIGVIGPREASAAQREIAEAVGAALASMGLAVVCGGRQGVMEAVCRGVAGQGGVSVGLLPEADPAAANPFVTVPIATGIGEARNALVARASFCIVAIGDSYGTLSEVALGLQFGKTVLGLAGAARVPGVRHFERAEDAIDGVARLVLAVPD